MLETKLEDYYFYRSIENSRNYFVQRGDTGIEVMAPIADLIQSSNKPNCQFFYDQKEKKFVIQALRHIKAEEVITIDFGTDSQLKNLMGFGTIITDPKDEVHFYHITTANPVVKQKFELVFQRSYSLNDILFQIRSIYQTNLKDDPSFPISFDNETKSVEFGIKVFGSQLKSYASPKEVILLVRPLKRSLRMLESPPINIISIV